MDRGRGYSPKEFPLRTVIFIPPLPRITGGMAVLLQIAAHLQASGQSVELALREASPSLLEAVQAALPPGLACLDCRNWNDLQLQPGDCWLIPEGWPQALLVGLQAKAHCVVYVQNWAYFLSNLPENTFWEQLPVRFIAVSEPVRHFIHYTTGRDAPLLRPAVDPALFYPPQREPAAPAGNTLRISYMPRKNSALARQIRETCTARLHSLHGGQPPYTLEWVEIHHKSPQQVAEMLRSSHIFLATGFPEGFSLPPLEAMASGCIVVGFAGLGGWDYMRQAAPLSGLPADTLDNTTCLSAYTPPLPLPPLPWSGNGFFTADADVLAAAEALEQACSLLIQGGPALARLREAAACTAAAYSPARQAAAIAQLWQHWLPSTS